jgi:hypothetical protein
MPSKDRVSVISFRSNSTTTRLAFRAQMSKLGKALGAETVDGNAQTTTLSEKPHYVVADTRTQNGMMGKAASMRCVCPLCPTVRAARLIILGASQSLIKFFMLPIRPRSALRDLIPVHGARASSAISTSWQQ